MSTPPPPPPTTPLPRVCEKRLWKWTQENGGDFAEDSESFPDVGTGPPNFYETHFRLEQTNPALPPILYRVTYDGYMSTKDGYTNEGSMGINNEEEGFKSQHMKVTGKAMDLETMEGEEIQRSIVNHINNVQKARDQAFQSPWISFSCSLLTTVHRAMWLLTRGNSNVTITAVDTSTLSSNKFICTATGFSVYANQTEDRRFFEYYCDDEYLVFNQLQGECSRVPFLEFFGEGINKLLPELNASDVHTSRLPETGLERLRTAAFENEYPLSTTEIDTCARLAGHLFTSSRCFLIYFALLALRRRPARDPAIVIYAWEKMKQLRSGFAFDNKGRVRLDNLFHLSWRRDFSQAKASKHIEIKQFAKIGAELTDLAEAFEKEIAATIMRRLWNEYDWVMDQMGKKLDGDSKVRELYENIRLTFGEHTLLMLELWNGKAKELVVKSLHVARKWL
ncbi:hypothetical protein LTS15_001289 [Exophiala xenobiotica]|nr:hypothetical protein LTS15_001289 [Exophiala xenobiotica]